MKKTKENAITLVALVITIVILLILAGIAISNLLGENGLIKQAKVGKEKYAISEAKEKIELEITNLQVEQQAKGELLTKEILSKINNDDIDVRDTSNFPVEVICGKYKFEVDNVFQVKYIGEADGTVIKYTTEPDDYTNQSNVKVLLKISNPKGIKSIKKPGEKESEIVKNQTKIETDFSVSKNGHYTIEVIDAEDKEVKKDIYIDLIDTLSPEEFTPEVQKNENSITVIENGKDADATEESSKSGIDHYEYYIIDSSDKETKYDTNKVDNLELGTYKLYLIAFDKAGNSKKSNIINFTISIKFSKIAVGYNHSLAINEKGDLYSWGGGGVIFEDGKTKFSSGEFKNWGPAKMKIDFKIKEMSVGNLSHSLVIDEQGNLYSRALSRNDYGELGNGTTYISEKLIQISKGKKFSQISASEYHNLAIDNDGKLYSWGYNNYGQLGDGTTKNKLEPTLIMSGHKFVQVATGDYHSLAIDDEGKLWSWGKNDYKQLGDGTKENKKVPVQVLTEEKFIQISAYGYHSLALDEDGNVWFFGEKKEDTSNYSYSVDPSKLNIEKKIIQISTGCYHSLALDVEGNIWSWGSNRFGQLGDGTTKADPSPKQIASDKKFVQIAAGWLHSLAVDTNGIIWGCGGTNDWALGISPNKVRYKSSPIQIEPAHK